MLIYTGGGYGGAQPNIPARDLTDEEVKQYGGAEALLKTGLYERADAARTAPKREPPIEKRKEGE